MDQKGHQFFSYKNKFYFIFSKKNHVEFQLAFLIDEIVDLTGQIIQLQGSFHFACRNVFNSNLWIINPLYPCGFQSLQQITLIMGGNNSGLIQNKTSDQYTYSLHIKELQATEKTTKTNYGGQLNVTTSGGLNANAKVQAKQEAELKEVLQCNQSVYSLGPFKIARAGLIKVDFETVKFLSIYNVTKKKYVMNNSKISASEHIRIKLEKDGHPTFASKQEAEFLEEIAQKQSLKKTTCPQCKENTSLKKVPGKCCWCGSSGPTLWYCKAMNAHSFCPGCEEGNRLKMALQNIN